MRNVLIAISRLHCMDGIASNLSTLMPALTQVGWKPHFAVGLVDCPPEYKSRLNRLKTASSSYHEEALLACQGGLGPKSIWNQSTWLKNVCQQLDIDILHLRGRALGPAAALCKWRGGPSVVNVPPLAPTRQEQQHSGILTRMQGRFFGDRVIAISGEMAELLHSIWGVPADRIRHVPHGVSLSHFTVPTQSQSIDARSKLGLPHSTFIISQIARVGDIKRPDTVIQAVAQLSRSGRDVAGVFAGHCNSSDREKLQRLSNSLGIGERIYFLGNVDARTILWASDAKVLASEREGFGIAVIEAMACGVPTVRTPVEGAQDQIVNGENGMLFPIGDYELLATCLARLIDDSSFRERLSLAASKTAKDKFSDRSMARSTVAVYSELCK